MKAIERFKDREGNLVVVHPGNIFTVVHRKGSVPQNLPAMTEITSTGGAVITVVDPEGSFAKWFAESLE